MSFILLVQKKKYLLGGQHWNTTISNYVNNSGTNDTWNGRINVDKIREFTLMGDMGNPNAALDFQFNIKKKMIDT